MRRVRTEVFRKEHTYADPYDGDALMVLTDSGGPGKPIRKLKVQLTPFLVGNIARVLHAYLQAEARKLQDATASMKGNP